MNNRFMTTEQMQTELEEATGKKFTNTRVLFQKPNEKYMLMLTCDELGVETIIMEFSERDFKALNVDLWETFKKFVAEKVKDNA